MPKQPLLPIDSVLSFVAEVITPLFAIERTMVLPFKRSRRENVGEHSLALSLLAGALAERIDTSLDTAKITEYAVVHDIVEIHVGDVTVWESDDAISKKVKDEVLAADRILRDFPDFSWAVRKYREYEARDTPEKQFVYALDKIYPHILITIGNHHPVHPSWEAYKRTEEVAYAKIKASFPGLLPLFDELCAIFRQRPHYFSTPIPANEQP